MIDSDISLNEVKKESVINVRVASIVYEIIKNKAIQNNMELSEYIRRLLDRELYPYILSASLFKKLPIGEQNEQHIEELIIKEFISDNREDVIDDLIKKLKTYKTKMRAIRMERKKLVEKYSKKFNREFINF